MKVIKSVLAFVGAWVFNILISLDQLANVVFLFGNPDETISSRAGKGRLAGSFAWTLAAGAIDLIFLPFEKDHCYKSIEWDE